MSDQQEDQLLKNFKEKQKILIEMCKERIVTKDKMGGLSFEEAEITRNNISRIVSQLPSQGLRLSIKSITEINDTIASIIDELIRINKIDFKDLSNPLEERKKIIITLEELFYNVEKLFSPKIAYIKTEAIKYQFIPKKAILVILYYIFIIILFGFISVLAYFNKIDIGVFRKFVLIFSLGALGGATLASRHVERAVRHSRYDERRLLWQIMTPLHGGVMACIAYLALNGGIIAFAQKGVEKTQVWEYSIMAISFIVGMISETFVKKLIQAGETFFGEKQEVLDGE